ncbi:hypothetical protein Strop_0525 [Salinispora tropica CNB-440]|uniref:Uncharacterized protein n=1 Tax=Salinispora tropica (strain ATCC BAA-916 / DSM 44818 / JCM 13857 / NBRC 105044 / CNB-440) TaxID=369723 RepID=A4X2A9_SALTO|nr:hypothetical protein Strop_0525 [Salinispora tropica CNB-440]
MRVIIFVPDSRGSARTRRVIQREVVAQGHVVVGATSAPAEAMAAWRSQVADSIAGRPDHLIQLADDWALPITSRSRPDACADTEKSTAHGRSRAKPSRARRYRRLPGGSALRTR